MNYNNFMKTLALALPLFRSKSNRRKDLEAIGEKARAIVLYEINPDLVVTDVDFGSAEVILRQHNNPKNK
ncbi:hypothetical protein KKH18_00535 [bacterium]|nr:hypothetical protein [bacterium]